MGCTKYYKKKYSKIGISIKAIYLFLYKTGGAIKNKLYVEEVK